MEMQILEYSLCLIEYVAFFVFVDALLDKRFTNYLPLIIVVIAEATITFFFSTFSMTVKLVISLTLLVMGSSFLYRDKLIVKFSYSLLFLFFLSIIDIISGNLFALVIDDDYSTVFYSVFTYRLASCLVIKAIDVLILFIMQKAFKHIDKNLKSKYWGLFSAIFLVLLVTSIIFLDFYLNLHQSKELIWLLLFISLAFLAMSLIVVYFFAEICSGFQRDKRLFALESNNRALEEALAIQSSNSENLRKIRHDISKHTANAVALIKSGKADEAAALLKNVGETAEQIALKYNINTGNSVVDTIISSRAALCESKGILFMYHIEPLEGIEIETVDLSSLLSNLLDNAIEAAQKTANGYIKIEIYKYKAYYGICVENSFMGKDSIVHSGFRLLSTKSNNIIHGYGTQIIEDIARKYNGDSTWNAEGESFKANVLLKI